jgi:hypothetical protein
MLTAVGKFAAAKYVVKIKITVQRASPLPRNIFRISQQVPIMPR